MQEPLAAAVVGLPTRRGLNEFDAILGGAIVNMSSIHGSVTTGLGASAFTAAKHGVVSLTKPAGVDYGPRGVRVNAVGPAYMSGAAGGPAGRGARRPRGQAPHGSPGPFRGGRLPGELHAEREGVLHHRLLPPGGRRLHGAVMHD